MSTESTIQTALGALVSGRCYPLNAPDPVVKPYIVFSVISDVSENDLDGDVNGNSLSNARIQVDVYHTTYGACKAIGGKGGTARIAMKTAFPQSVHLASRELYEQDTQLYRITSDFSIWS